MEIQMKVRWSYGVRVITIVVSLLLLFAEYEILSIFDKRNWLIIFCSLLVLLIFAYCISNSPVYVKLSDSELVFKKVIGRITIPYSEVKKVEVFKPEFENVRLFGSGGFWSYTGLFSNKDIGKYNSYVGDPDQAFLIQLNNGKNYAFSCENRDFVVDAIEKYIS